MKLLLFKLKIIFILTLILFIPISIGAVNIKHDSNIIINGFNDEIRQLESVSFLLYGDPNYHNLISFLTNCRNLIKHNSDSTTLVLNFLYPLPWKSKYLFVNNECEVRYIRLGEALLESINKWLIDYIDKVNLAYPGQWQNIIDDKVTLTNTDVYNQNTYAVLFKIYRDIQLTLSLYQKYDKNKLIAIQEAYLAFSKFKHALAENDIPAALKVMDPRSARKYRQLFEALDPIKMSNQAKFEMIGLYPTSVQSNSIEFIGSRGRRGVFIYMMKFDDKWYITRM